MVPNKDGHANHGHSCVKGRFAWGYATHKDRITKPMIRKKITDPWQEVSWDEAIGYAASRVQAHPGDSTAGTRSAASSSSRCTNEETYLVQKLVRAAFGNNNIDTCARVCHSPTGYGLKADAGRVGRHAGLRLGPRDRRHHRHRRQPDRRPPGVRLAHEAAAARRAPRLIVVDPRRIDLVRSPHVEADYHLKLRPGTNVAIDQRPGARHRDRGPRQRRRSSTSAARWTATSSGRSSSARPEHSPEATEDVTGVPAARGARGGPPLRHRRQRRHLLRPRRHRAQPGLDHGHGHRQPRDGDRQHRPRGRGREPAARPEQRAGLLRHGIVPARATPATGTCSTIRRARCSRRPGACRSSPEPGLRIPNMFDAALDGSFKGLYLQGEDIAQSDPNTQHVTAALEAMECIVVQDLFLNETAKFAHVFLPGSLVPGEERHLHQRRASDLARCAR